MRILLNCQFFNYFSGTSMYVHDLAIELKKRGHDVTILSDLGGEISNSAIKADIRLIDYSQIFKIQQEKFDIIHINQTGPGDFISEFFDAPIIQTLHTELGNEMPFFQGNVKAYIAVRPEVSEKFHQLNPILIRDGIDMNRFNTDNAEEVKKKKKEVGMKEDIILFTGIIDQVKSFVVRDLMDHMQSDKYEFWVVGRSFLPFALPSPVKSLTETFFIEKWIEMADSCAGVFAGRNAIEAWACGKPYICYSVDNNGKILSKETMNPPEDMTQYSIEYMTDRVEEVYNQALK